MMAVEDNGSWYVVKNVFDDNIVGPFDSREDAEYWMSCYLYQDDGSDE